MSQILFSLDKKEYQYDDHYKLMREAIAQGLSQRNRLALPKSIPLAIPRSFLIPSRQRLISYFRINLTPF